MNKSKLAIAIDSTSITIIIFITLVFFFKNFIKNAFFLYFSCILFSILAFILIFKYFIKQYNLKNITKNEQLHLENCLDFFRFSNQNDVKLFFEKLFSAKFLIDNFYENENTIFYINLRFILSDNDYYKILDCAQNKNKQTIIICQKFDESFKNLLNIDSYNFIIYDTVDLYTFMKEKKLFPISHQNKKTFKQSAKVKFNLFTSSISKHRFKDYFISGLSLLTLSLFLPFTFYYSIFGIIFLLLSIICLFSKKSNQSKLNQTKLKLSDILKNSTGNN